MISLCWHIKLLVPLVPQGPGGKSNGNIPHIDVCWKIGSLHPDFPTLDIEYGLLYSYYTAVHMYSSRHPSISRDNGKASLLGVETQRSHLSQGMCQDEKIEK